MAKKTEQKVWDESGRGRRQCPECEKYVPSAVAKCPNCHHEFPAKPRRPRGKAAAVEVDPGAALQEQMALIIEAGGVDAVKRLIVQVEEGTARLEPLGGVEKAKATLATLEQLALFFQAKGKKKTD